MLSDNYPTFRLSDPETSRQPVKNKGRLRFLILRAIAAYETLTAGEIGEATGIDGAWKRLHELERDGLIVRGTPRYYSGTDRYQATWHLAPDRQLTLLEVDNG